ncbi:MAG: hypothetical protein QN178_06315 [Armatimonadota bacterium]|nr:hypothetical protein [Armatimonadota bacterium]
MTIHSGLVLYPKIAHSLAGLILHPITLERAKALIASRLAHREARFLEMVRTRIYDHARSPYRTLLRMAGCEMGDIERAVRRDGLETALTALREAGVYLSFEEFKARTEVVRGSQTFRFAESDFDNPAPGSAVDTRTGATTSRGSAVAMRFDFLAAQRAPSYHVMLDALDAADAPIVIWHPGFPSGAGISAWLALAKMGRPPRHWYSMTDPHGPTVAPRHRMLLETAHVLSRAVGRPLPLPDFTPVSQPERVADGLRAILGRHGRCALITTPSAAVRLAAAAGGRDAALSGLAIIVGAEPLTEGKRAEIVATGARVGVQYVLTEGGAIGAACGRPAAADDTHFMADCYAMILHRREWPLVGEVDAFMFTTLLPSAPKIMLNVESDDFGVVTHRECGCAWDALGLRTHLHTIRSFTKLTGEGVTVLGTDCLRVLEEILPREFGGRSIDYQLLEAEDEDRLTRLLLVVSPSVGPVDEERVRARFIEELRDRTRPRSVMPPLWRQAETIRVVRREPLLTPRGKLLPFYTQAATARPGQGMVTAQ